MIASLSLLVPAPFAKPPASEADSAADSFEVEKSGTGALFLNGERGGKFLEDRPEPLRPEPLRRPAPPAPPRALRNPRWLEERRPFLLLAVLASAPGPTREVLDAPRSARCDSMGPRLGWPRA